MKYIDILKNFDKAIITESQKLKEIYDELCKGETPSNQICNETEDEKKKKEFFESSSDNEKEPSKPNQGEAVDAEKIMREFATENDKGDAEPTPPTPDDKKDAEPTPPTPDGKEDGKKREMYLDPSKFFDSENLNETQEESSTPDDGGDGKEDSNQIALSASDLFATNETEEESSTPTATDDDDESSTPTATDNDEDGESSTPPTPTTTDSGEGETTDESENCKTLADWLGESDMKDDENKDIRGDEEEDIRGDEEEDKNEKCPKCQNNPCSCNNDTEAPAPEDDEDDEARQEAEALEESIKNISAFVRANKKLFVG